MLTPHQPRMDSWCSPVFGEGFGSFSQRIRYFVASGGEIALETKPAFLLFKCILIAWLGKSKLYCEKWSSSRRQKSLSDWRTSSKYPRCEISPWNRRSIWNTTKKYLYMHLCTKQSTRLKTRTREFCDVPNFHMETVWAAYVKLLKSLCC